MVVVVQFGYVDNSGLLEWRADAGSAQTWLYDYDDYGRLSGVVRPTGHRLAVSPPAAGTPTAAYSRRCVEYS